MDGDLEESKQKSSKFKEKNFDKSFEKSIFSQGDNELQDLFSRNPDDSQSNTFLNNFTDDNREENEEYKGTSPKIYDNIQSEQNINSLDFLFLIILKTLLVTKITRTVQHKAKLINYQRKRK